MRNAHPFLMLGAWLFVLGWAAPMPRLAAAETVVVTYKSGKKERGELVAYDLEQIVLRITLGKNKLEFKIPWKRVQKVSNGLSYEVVLKRWKEKNKDNLCPACGGDRQVRCPKCKGSGFLAKKMVVCKACQGSGVQRCAAKGCEQGRTACPAPCLKLSEGQWEKGEEGLRWRKFTYPGGWQSWSERHLGEVIEIRDGKPVNLGKCKVCGGTTKVDCKVCKGTGQVVCARCKGAKRVPAPGPTKKCPACKAGKIPCTVCKGTGLKKK